MLSDRRRKNPDSERYYNYYRCVRRRTKGKDACSQSKNYRAEEIEGVVWSYASGYLKDPERLRIGLDRMIQEKRRAMGGDPTERPRFGWRRSRTWTASARGHKTATLRERSK